MSETVRVLVVERDNQMRKAIAKTLKRESRIQVIDFASTGYEAVTKSMKQIPQVVLMNVSIETSNAGIYACNEIRVNTPEVKVILYGVDCPKDTIIRAFQTGAVNFLIGEYTETELIGAVLDAFDDKVSIHYSTATQLRQECKRILDLHDNLIYMLNVLIKLTATEITILKYFNNGIRGQEIAKILFISNTTMKTHISHILKKFNLETMAQVVEVLHLTELFSMINPNSDEM